MVIKGSFMSPHMGHFMDLQRRCNLFRLLDPKIINYIVSGDTDHVVSSYLGPRSGIEVRIASKRAKNPVCNASATFSRLVLAL